MFDLNLTSMATMTASLERCIVLRERILVTSSNSSTACLMRNFLRFEMDSPMMSFFTSYPRRNAKTMRRMPMMSDAIASKIGFLVSIERAIPALATSRPAMARVSSKKTVRREGSLECLMVFQMLGYFSSFCDLTSSMNAKRSANPSRRMPTKMAAKLHPRLCSGSGCPILLMPSRIESVPATPKRMTATMKLQKNCSLP